MKVWVTKYCLTKGIQKFEAKIVGSSSEMILVGTTYFYGKGSEWHTSLEKAKKYAENERQKKIKSLEKSIEKLRNLKF